MDIKARLERHFASRRPSPVVAAYLYGSHAEGRPHRESDLDLAVLLNASLPENDRFALRLDLTGDLMSALHFNEVDLIVLNDAPPLLAARIVSEGLLVYEADPEAHHGFRRDIQLRAADLGPFIERYRRRLMEEVGR